MDWRKIGGQNFRAAAAATLLAGAGQPALAQNPACPSELYFSEYVEGSLTNKAVEIYNGTGAAVTLTGAYDLQICFNGSTACTTYALTGAVAAGDVFVFAAADANAAILGQADQTVAAGVWNGDDAVLLRKGGAVVDALGQVGFDPGSEWGTGATGTSDATLRRKAEVLGGDAN